MALIPAGYGEAHYRFGGTAFPFGAEVTVGFKNNGAATPAAICSVFELAWNGNIRSQHTTHTTLEEILVKLGPNDIGPFASIFPGSAGTGDTQDTIPSLAVLVKKLTALGGRRHRGRMFWPILSEVEFDNGGTIGTTSLAGVQSAMNAWMAALAADDCPLYLLHSDATAPDLITGLSAENRLATQRRRLRG